MLVNQSPRLLLTPLHTVKDSLDFDTAYFVTSGSEINGVKMLSNFVVSSDFSCFVVAYGNEMF